MNLPVGWIALGLMVFAFTFVSIYAAGQFFIAHGTNQSYEQMCPNIEPDSLHIQYQAMLAMKKTPGNTLHTRDYIGLYEWFKDRIRYASDPDGFDDYAPALATLTEQKGDCEDQAILAASMIRSLGGTSRVVAVPECHHAFAMVPVGDVTQLQGVTDEIVKWYKDAGYPIRATSIQFFRDKDEQYWLIVDPAGGDFLGDTYPDCRLVRDIRFYC